VLLTRGALIGFVISWVALIVAIGWLFDLTFALHDQQRQTHDLAKANAHTVNLVCKLATGLALNTPKLDARFLHILNDILEELPERCFVVTK